MEAYEKVLDGSFLGKGSFGIVEKVRRKRDSKILACKTIWFVKDPSKAKRECGILKQLDHPNIVQQSEVEWLDHHVKIYMEYCEGGSLQDLIDEKIKEGALLPEQYVWNIASQLASALLYCHAGSCVDEEGRLSEKSDWETILHRDIKPANVLMMNRMETAFDSIKLGDFGLGYVLRNDNNPRSYVGTGQFLAPEINGQTRIRWTTDCDMFSFGCTLYTLCKLTPPFARHMESVHEPYSPIPDIYTSDLKDLIASCLSFSPDSRPKDLLHLLQQCRCWSKYLRHQPRPQPKKAQHKLPTRAEMRALKTPTKAPPSARGMNAGKSVVEQNRTEEERLAKEALKSSSSKGTEVGLGVKLPDRGSSLTSGDGNQTSQRGSSKSKYGRISSSGKLKPDVSKTRVWTDRSGSFKVEAQFIGLKDGKIHLHKLNGVKIAVPVAKMAIEDLELARSKINCNQEESKLSHVAINFAPSELEYQARQKRYQEYEFDVNDLKDMKHDKTPIKDTRHDKNGLKDTKHDKNGIKNKKLDVNDLKDTKHDKNGTRDMKYDKNDVKYQSWANVVRHGTVVKKT